MSDADDEKILNMRINNKQFLQGANQSVQALGRVDKAVDAAGKSKGLSNLGNNIQTVKAKFGALQVAGVTALANITNRAVNAGINLAKSLTINPVMDGFREYEKLLTSTQTVMANTGKSSAVVGKYLDDLNHYADQTVYNFGQMADNIGKFTAAGVSVDAATSSIKGLANAAALSGSSTEQLNSAMYQMSQALSSGTIKLQDWNSLQAAGMAGSNIQNALKETARTFGDQGKAMDGAIKKYGNFRESLRSGWLSSDVFNKTMKVMAGTTNKAGKTVAYTVDQLKKMGYSAKAAKELNRLSAAAINSATKIKTFSQLMDVTKEALGSGWAQIFRQLFGNLEQSGKMWTAVGNVVTGAISKMFTGISDMLGQWRKLGGFEEFWGGIGNIFKSIGNVLRPVFDIFSAILPASNSAGSGMYKLTHAFYEFSVWLEKVTSGTGSLSPVMSVVGQVFGIVGAVVSGVVRYFYELVKLLEPLGTGFLDIVGSVGTVIGKLLEMADIGDKIDKVFDFIINGREKALEPFIKTLSGIQHAIAALITGDVSGFKSMFSDALSNLGPVGEAISNVAAKIQAFFASIKNTGDPVIDSIVNKITQFAGAVSSFFGGLGSSLSSVENGTAKMTSFAQTGEKVSQTGERVSAAWEKVKSIFSAVGGAIGTGLSKIGQFFSGLFNQIGQIDKLDIANIISTIFSGAILYSVLKFMNALSKSMVTFKEFGESLKGVVDNAGGVFEQLTNNLKTMQNAVKAKMILNIAIAVGILAASLWVLSKIPKDELAKALVGVSVSIGVLVGSMAVLGKAMAGGGGVQIALATASMIAMATALTVLAGAIAIYGNMKISTLAQGLTVIAISLGILVGVSFLMSKMSKSLILGAGAMLIMAFALTALAGPIKLFAMMDWSTIISGMAKMVVVMAAMAAGMFALSLVGPEILLASAAIAALAVSLTLMAGALKIFNGLSWGEVISGVTKIAAALLILAAASTVAAGPLTALGVAMILIGAGFLAIGAGLALAGIGLTAIAAAGVAAFAAIVAGVEIFLSLIPVMSTQFAAGMVALLDAAADAAPKIVDSLVKIGSEFLRGIRELSPEIAKTGESVFLDLLSTAENVIPQMQETGVAIILAFLNSIADKTDAFVDAGTKIVTNFMSGVGNNADEITTAAGEMILDVLTAIDNAVVTYGPQISEKGREIAKHVIEGFVLGLVPEPIREKLGEVVDDFVNFFKGLLGINSPSTVFQGFGKDIVQGLINGISDLIGNAKNKVEELGKGVVSKFREIPGKVRSALSTVRDIVKTAITSGFRNLGDLGSDAVSKARALPGRIGSALSGLRSIVESAFRGAFGGLGSIVSSAVAAATRAVGGGSSKAVGKGGKIGKNARGTDYWRGGLSLVGEMGPELVSMNKGSAVITNKNLVGFMGSVSRLAKAMSSGVSNVTAQNGSGQIQYSVSADFKGDPKKTGLGFAANIAAGLSTGMDAQRSKINESSASAAAGLAKSFADILEINSPSKVFYKYAAFVGQGFINGLLASVKSVQNAAKTMAKAATDTVSKTIKDSQLKFESKSGVASAYARNADDLRKRAERAENKAKSSEKKAKSYESRSKNKKLSGSERSKAKSNQKRAEAEQKRQQSIANNLNRRAKYYERNARSAQRSADLQGKLVQRENERAERAEQYKKADTQGKADMRNEDAKSEADRASAQRQKAIQYSLEADLIRSRDRRRAKELDKAAKLALDRARASAKRSDAYAKQADQLSQQAKVEAAAAEIAEKNIQLSTVTAADVSKAQALFNQYAKSLDEAQGKGGVTETYNVEFNPTFNSPVAMSRPDVFRENKSLLNWRQDKIRQALKDKK